ncbi:HAD-IA family hydrolase [Maribacter sp.]|uniref:HAD-IA family hydrolase n=1 Tax=Maribacter sp. TaxID=1897614 RepID=UPI0025C59436|nr:HAD-IA family hydrolase [Maribacter sp.]
MIKNIIFDFGDIFINLDKQAPLIEMAKFGFTELTPDLDAIFKSYEMGLITSDVFVEKLQGIFTNASKSQIIDAWNSIILDFPEERLKFIEKLKADNQYRLFLLSNTNDLHIDKVKESMGMERFLRFKNCFEVFYLSQEMKMRKPNANIYEKVLSDNNLNASETFFIDDTKENTDSASKLGIQCWNLQVGKEDVLETLSRIV